MSASRNSRSSTARNGATSTNDGKMRLINRRSLVRIGRDLFHFVEIVREVCRIEFTLDFPIATKQAAMRDVVLFSHQMRGDKDGLAAFGFKAKRVLQSLSPARIETQARFIEQQHWRVGQEQ